MSQDGLVRCLELDCCLCAHCANSKFLVNMLEIPCGHNIIRQCPPHTHTLLLVDQEAVVFHLDVRLQLGLDVLQLSQGLFRLFVFDF